MWGSKPKPIPELRGDESVEIKVLTEAAQNIANNLARFYQSHFDSELKDFARKAGLLKLVGTIKTDLKLDWEVGIHANQK